MAFATESPPLKFENSYMSAYKNPYNSPYENSYTNPYTNGIPPPADIPERRWSGSSTEYSQNTKGERDEGDAGVVHAENEKAEQALSFQNITAPDATRILSFHHPGCKRKNLIVKDDDGKTIYYADVS